MVHVSAVIACVILVVIAAFHVYWAAGGESGKAGAIPTSGGRPVIAPIPIGTALVGVALLVAAVLVAATAGLVRTPFAGVLLRLACGGLALVFLGRAVGDFRYVGFFKRVVGSRFATRDTLVYSPLCAVLAALIGVVTIASQVAS